MTTTGIIAEFNPFHKGHAYLLEEARGLKIVAMSGNFMQRGEPAIVDKWTRTQIALENGADVVVELPFLVSVQSADYFAQGAIAILKQLGIDQLSFGTEEVIDYQTISDTYAEHREAMEGYVASLPDTFSYPQKTQVMWEKFCGIAFSGGTPNHILALAYTKACAGTDIKLAPIQRQGAGFHDTVKETSYASATAIRQHITNKAFVQAFAASPDLLLQSPHVSWETYFPLLRYQILSHADLTAIYQVNEELAQRIRAAIKTSTTFDGLVAQITTKRYTKARVRRILTYILVNARETLLPEGIHVLGFSQKGQEHLAKVKHRASLITKIGKEPWDAMTQQADQIYQLGHPDLKEQNWGRVPVRETDKK